jgi:hypothetical protein
MKIIQKIFTDHAGQYRKNYRLSQDQRKVIDAICTCRTPQAGQHAYECPDCGQSHIADSSCGNRHCPVCQNDKAMQWVYRQELKKLQCKYFLSTFTLPRQLHEVARRHPDTVYRALFDESSASLKDLMKDKRFVGCDLPGFFGILHTWGRQIQYHPHIHYVIAGGGVSPDGDKWLSSADNFLVHIRALSAIFKTRLKERLKKEGLLELIPGYVWQKDWVVHCKAVGNGRNVLKYLGAYVFRVGISNARIIDYDGKKVTFKYYKVGSSRPRKCTLDALEFIRRYLQHVLPSGFMKVRHYGFMSGKCRISIDDIRKLISDFLVFVRERIMPEPPEKAKPLLCPRCSSPMKWVRYLKPDPFQVNST